MVKKKKKKKKSGDKPSGGMDNTFFEFRQNRVFGGKDNTKVSAISNEKDSDIQIENNIFFEGGSDDEDDD